MIKAAYRALLCGLFLLPFHANAIDIIPLVGGITGGNFEDEATENDIEIDNSASFGLALAFDSAVDKQYELLFIQQNSELVEEGGAVDSPLFDLRVQYLHIGGSYFYEGREQPLQPYVAGGLGITRLDPRIDGGQDEIRPSMNLGLGLNWMPVENLGLRAELRGYFSALDSGGSIRCGGGCDIKVNSSGFSQFQLNAGIVLRF